MHLYADNTSANLGNNRLQSRLRKGSQVCSLPKIHFGAKANIKNRLAGMLIA
jgi:hypothetical protein